MLYKSTRGHHERITASVAIQRGIAPDGGLYMPEELPKIDLSFLEALLPCSYSERAFRILSLYLCDYEQEALQSICQQAYSTQRFGEYPAPVVKLRDSQVSVLELWHGPTSAFKDMALQIMPLLLTKALEMTGETRTAYILVATSGDTGKAALEGYKDVKQTKLLVFYPDQGVSVMQKLQMTTQQGENVKVQAIDGNFDDAQSGLKIFADREVIAQLDREGCFLSSANSINWGRLAPQIVYYMSAYCDMVKAGTVKMGDPINVCVPTGNFGNIFAGILAAEMGLPVRKFICASNKNNILTDFLSTGVYDRKRDFYATMSPSMDILISSNLERLLYLRFGSERTAAWMKQLLEKGEYALTKEDKSLLDTQLTGGWCDEEQTAKTIRDMFDSHHYLADTHTAVALHAARERTTQDLPLLVLSTASPYKFPVAVYASLTGRTLNDDFEALGALSHYTGTTIPSPIASLHTLPVRFQGTVDKADMKKMVLAG